ncbi:hypothetical protein M9H77_35501 [Catharanthus roseus]|uniref:Uncharacterized protein n=1 Tax=Catharanthus roseus TaxID=4058 RepID=A0ACB9ZRR2_CATRO|nr:hypothetical protein M9H77_35501 [Catharanthus roseus]
MICSERLMVVLITNGAQGRSKNSSLSAPGCQVSVGKIIKPLLGNHEMRNFLKKEYYSGPVFSKLLERFKMSENRTLTEKCPESYWKNLPLHGELGSAFDFRQQNSRTSWLQSSPVHLLTLVSSRVSTKIFLQKIFDNFLRY